MMTNWMYPNQQISGRKQQQARFIPSSYKFKTKKLEKDRDNIEPHEALER